MLTATRVWGEIKSKQKHDRESNGAKLMSPDHQRISCGDRCEEQIATLVFSSVPNNVQTHAAPRQHHPIDKLVALTFDCGARK